MVLYWLKLIEIKYLGVIIDKKLTWISHITYVKNKVSKGIGIMFKAKKILKRNTLINLYHSYIYPYLIYCIEAWGNASNCHLEQLYLTQKKVARMISFSNYNAHSIDIFKQLNILPLNKLVINRIGIRMYKYANNLLPPVINDMYTTNSDVPGLLYTGQWKLSVYTRERTQSRPTCGAVMGWKRLISGLDSFLYTCGIIYYTE